MDIEMLKTIAQQAQNKLARVYELYDLGEPPSVTPGIVEAVLEAAAQQQPQQHHWQYNDPNNEPIMLFNQPSYYIQRGWEPPIPATKVTESCTKTMIPSPKPDKAQTEAAVIARLRELATDGIMPKQTEWNAKRGDLPNAALLYENWDGRKWAEWAELAGLVYAGPRGSGKRKARKTEADATPEATFCGGEHNGAAAPDYPVTHYIEADGSVHWSRD